MNGLILSEQQKNSRAVFHPSRIIPLIILTILALFGTSCTRAEAFAVEVIVTPEGAGTATVTPNPVNAGETVTVTCSPAVGYKVASAQFLYLTGPTSYHDGEITIDNNTGTFVFGSDAQGYLTVSVTFAQNPAYLAGGETAESPVAITDNTILGLRGGYYAVNSDITFDHTITLLGDVTLTIAEGATMSVKPEINGNNYAGSLTVSGDGALNVKHPDGGRSYALNSVNSYTQTGATVSIDNTGWYGMLCKNVKISGGTLTTSGFTYGMSISDNTDIMSGVVTAKTTGGDRADSDMRSGGSFNISGGQVTANIKGIERYGNPIVIGYTESTDSITAIFLSNVTVMDNCMFTDGTNDYSGGLNTSDVNGKTLTPKICTVTIEGDNNNITADTTSTLYGRTVTLNYTGEVPAGL